LINLATGNETVIIVSAGVVFQMMAQTEVAIGIRQIGIADNGK
jgi:hypothetical protein